MKRQKRKNAWSDEDLALLGAMTDIDVGKKTGRSKPAITAMRLKLGILPYIPKSSVVYNKNKIKHQHDIMGLVSDKVIAEKLNVAQSSVCKVRNQLGIKLIRNDYTWAVMKNLRQVDFFNELNAMHGGGLTYKKLADMCYVSHSRCQKWFAPGCGQERLHIRMRRYIYLEVLFNLK